MDEELKVTEHWPDVLVVQLEALKEPRVVERAITTLDLLSEVEAVIVDDWLVVMVLGFPERDRLGVVVG